MPTSLAWLLAVTFYLASFAFVARRVAVSLSARVGLAVGFGEVIYHAMDMYWMSSLALYCTGGWALGAH